MKKTRCFVMKRRVDFFDKLTKLCELIKVQNVDKLYTKMLKSV